MNNIRLQEDQSITIEGIRQKCRVGCTQEERAWPQLLQIDVRFSFDMSDAIQKDDLTKTVDYMQVIDSVKILAENKEWKLIETLSADIAHAIFERWDMIKHIEVTVFKSVSETCERVACRTRWHRP